MEVIKLKRLPKGTLVELSQKTGIKTNYLCDLIATRKRPGRKRALFLSAAAGELGKDIPPEKWLYGTRRELMSALAA